MYTFEFTGNEVQWSPPVSTAACSGYSVSLSADGSSVAEAKPTQGVVRVYGHHELIPSPPPPPSPPDMSS